MKAVMTAALLCCVAFAPLPANAQSGSFSVNTRRDSVGNVQTGSTKTDSVTVTNTGTGTLTISSVKSSNARFTAGPANASLAAGASRKFGITFSPLVTGAQSSFVTFTHNGATSPDTVTALGTGTAPAFSVNKKSAAFGFVVIGTAKPDSVIVTNTGTAPLVISSATSSNVRYVVSPASASIQPGAKSTFRITFTPTVTGAQNGNIIFVHNAPTVRDTVTVTGTGTGFSINRRSVAFGSVQVGTNARDSVTVTNAGATTLAVSSVTSNNARFTVSPASASIPAAGNAKFYITFTPVTSSVQSGSVVFVHNATGSPDTVMVSGTGTLPGFSLNRKSIPFGFVLIGGNKLDSVTVADTGTAALVISAVASNNGTFTVNPTNATIQPAQARKFYITFTPSGTAPQAGNIVFTHNAPGTHDTVSVTGTGGRPGFTLNRRTVPFGIVALGSSRQDSVSVTDTGTVALVVTGITSSNGTFTVNPANATIQASQSKTFIITFTPANLLAQNGNLVFTHNAASLRDTVGVTGTGGTPGVFLNRKSIAFGTVVVGNSRLDSVTVTDTGAVALVISSVASSNGRFSVNPQNATVQPGKSRTFSVLFTPLTTSTQNGILVLTHNAPGLHDTVTLSGNGVAPLPPPLLIAPASGATGQPMPDSLSWQSVAGASGYRLAIATDSLFATIVLYDSTIVAPARQVSGLPQNTLYYWKVATRNDAGSGAFSAAWTFTTLPAGPVAGTISFSGDASSTSYRMFGLPGIGSRRTGDILSGTQKLDWRILRDTGKDTTYPAYYTELTADSILRTGEGYWLLQRKDLIVSRTDTLPPLGTDGTYSVPLHTGWNMISNPFNATVQRSAVIAANALPAGTVFWEHVGGTRTSGGTTLEPFKGYYFDNDTAMLPALKIPYPFSTSVARPAKTTSPGWRMELVFESDINTDRDNYAGIAPGVRAGRNELDQHEPPLVFDQGFLYFVRPQWDAAHSRFATDIRGDLGNGQTWDFEVWNPRKSGARISIGGLEAVPQGNQVVIVNLQNTSPADMRATGTYAYQTVSTKMEFKIIVGPKAYVDGETSKLVPQAYALEQNFPNPFNPSTTIRYLLPAGSVLRLEILSVIGQRVRLLDEGYRTAGTYSVIWDGRDDRMQPVSSGVYFCRLTAGGSATMTRKLLLLK